MPKMPKGVKCEEVQRHLALKEGRQQIANGTAAVRSTPGIRSYTMSHTEGLHLLARHQTWCWSPAGGLCGQRRRGRWRVQADGGAKLEKVWQAG